MIAYASYEVMKDAIHPLMGEKPSDKLKKQLTIIGEKELGFNPDIHHVHIHRYGDHVELTFHIVLPSDISLEKAHYFTDRLEESVEEELNMKATIHAEPGKRM